MARTKTRRFSPEVAQVIAFLESAQDRQALCATGQERLRWWRTHGHRYRTVRAALSTWTPGQVEEWLDYIGADYESGAHLNRLILSNVTAWSPAVDQRAQVVMDRFVAAENRRRRTATARRTIVLTSADQLLPS